VPIIKKLDSNGVSFSDVCNTRAYSNIDHSSYTTRTGYHSDANSCAIACFNDGNCFGFSYSKSTKKCLLKSSLYWYTRTADTDYISGPKHAGSPRPVVQVIDDGTQTDANISKPWISLVPSPAYPAQPTSFCWIRMPTGCGAVLSETSTPMVWFIDP
jgi:hypothetical protein